MSNWVDALKQTIEELKSHPLIAVDESNIAEPATADLLDTFEMITNIRLPQNVKAFYMSANGLSCIWRIRPDLPEETMNKIRNEGEQKDFDYSKPLGAIRILPVQDMLMDKYWKTPFQEGEEGNQMVNFNSREFTRKELAKKLKIFDAYYLDNDVKCMAFVTGLDTLSNQSFLLMLDNYFADWHNSRLVDFDTYLKAMCETRFTIPSREKLFGKYRGDQEPVLKYEELSKNDLVPALFK